MKKVFFIAMAFIAAISTNAQNIQLHYDFGRHLYSDEEGGRQDMTVTLEQFKADKWGSWFYFVDIDFSSKFTEGAYTEISSTTEVLTASVASSSQPFSVPHGTDTALTSPKHTPCNSCTSSSSRVTTTPRPMPAVNSRVCGAQPLPIRHAPSVASLTFGVARKQRMVTDSSFSSPSPNSGTTSTALKGWKTPT